MCKAFGEFAYLRLNMLPTDNPRKTDNINVSEVAFLVIWNTGWDVGVGRRCRLVLCRCKYTFYWLVSFICIIMRGWSDSLSNSVIDIY